MTIGDVVQTCVLPCQIKVDTKTNTFVSSSAIETPGSHSRLLIELNRHAANISSI
jgi:hypothetical protein